MSGISKDSFALLAKKSAAAIQNEHVTRIRVDILELQAERIVELLARNFIGRLRWLLFGR